MDEDDNGKFRLERVEACYYYRQWLWLIHFYIQKIDKIFIYYFFYFQALDIWAMGITLFSFVYGHVGILKKSLIIHILSSCLLPIGCEIYVGVFMFSVALFPVSFSQLLIAVNVDYRKCSSLVAIIEQLFYFWLHKNILINDQPESYLNGKFFHCWSLSWIPKLVLCLPAWS